MCVWCGLCGGVCVLWVVSAVLFVCMCVFVCGLYLWIVCVRVFCGCVCVRCGVCDCVWCGEVCVGCVYVVFVLFRILCVWCVFLIWCVCRCVCGECVGCVWIVCVLVVFVWCSVWCV